MTEHQFFSGITGNENDLRLAIEALKNSGQAFCLIGGLAVNHYVEPVVTLDADFAITASEGVENSLRKAGFSVVNHAHSINATYPGSRLRIQVTVNSRYGDFPQRAVPGQIFGLDVPVASMEDLVRGKIWALEDPARRGSKKAKDEADLIRLCESYPQLVKQIPPGIARRVDEMRTKE